MKTLIKGILGIAIVAALVAVGFWWGSASGGGAETQDASGEHEQLPPQEYALVGHPQIIQVVTSMDQIVLANVAVQGILSESSNLSYEDFDIPWSDRAAFVQYSFDATLGVNGADVTIEQTGDNECLVTVPQFIFIDNDDVEFELIAQQGGVLSWLTEPIDTVRMVNELQDDIRGQYIAEQQQVLQEQAAQYFEGVIRAVDETTVVNVVFAEV